MLGTRFRAQKYIKAQNTKCRSMFYAFTARSWQTPGQMDLVVFICIYQCWSERWITVDRTKRLNKTMSCKNKIAHFQWMRHLPRHQQHGTTGPNTAGNIHLSNRCFMESTGSFTKSNNQAAWRVLDKWLCHTLNIHLPETPDLLFPTAQRVSHSVMGHYTCERNNFSLTCPMVTKLGMYVRYGHPKNPIDFGVQRSLGSNL